MPKLPKYVEIENYFKTKIESGELQADQPLPPESEICAKFSTSHMTVSRAMNELAVHGYIKRIKGKGTFADHRFQTKIKKNSVRTESITDMIRNAGLKPSAELIKYGIIKGKEAPEIASVLHVAEDDFLHYFIRTRYGSGSLICISYSYISQNILPTMDIKRLEGSLNQYIEELGIERSYGYMELGACLPSPEQAKLIGSNHVPLLRQTIMWNVNDEPFELTMHYFVGDKFTITQDKIMSQPEPSAVHDHVSEPLVK
ncbi:GntR family transcriptional regulator [Holdemania massiliensis]|uniref:GntR family transcriptional regulator n=1 Tax=Holdemania massiliensis TaxID=1468449 RepID=UPI001F070318|nr:GntR family transcriptional regulator [Holdemania massiliensis]MCH1939698.1 GntR family transcriptional regulator [Holdemania massiliensis]